MPPAASPGPGKAHGFGTAAFVIGLFGGCYLAIVFGVIALVRIRRRPEERGKGLAIAGIALCGAWTMIVIIALVVGAVTGRGTGGVIAQLYPKTGECFNMPVSGSPTRSDVTACTVPHDGQVVVTFTMARGQWRGDQEVERLANEGCEQRIKAKFGTRSPVEDAELYTLVPQRLGWLAGDRGVACAFTGIDGKKLKGPIKAQVDDVKIRELTELVARDCVDGLTKSTATVRVLPCEKPHEAQVTHTFTLPNRPWPGQTAIDKSAEAGCNKHWDAYFDKHPSPVPVKEWYISPVKESWELGDRLTLCYVTAKSGKDLARSVMR